MNDSTLNLIASFLIMLSVSLLGLFVYMIRSARSESTIMITRLHNCVQKLVQMNNSNERTFAELEGYLKRRMTNLLVVKKLPFGTRAMQTEDLELGLFPEEKASQTNFGKEGTPIEDLELGLFPEKKASQTDFGKMGKLPPLLIRPALSSHVTLPVAD